MEATVALNNQQSKTANSLAGKLENLFGIEALKTSILAGQQEIWSQVGRILTAAHQVDCDYRTGSLNYQPFRQQCRAVQVADQRGFRHSANLQNQTPNHAFKVQ